MMKPSRLLAAAAIGAAFVFSSCAYDPYYSSAGGYSSSSYGYGDGYGYGGSNFSTSLFVSTGDSRWGYDPYCHSYYDYRSRRYYDPYLYGYYPVGYRPRAVYGVPHPNGWSQGRGYCPPPRTIRNVTVSNYRDRESAYRKSNYSWAKQVRVQEPSSHDRSRGHGLANSNSSNSYRSTQSRVPSQTNRYNGTYPSTRSSSGSRPPSGSYSSPSRGSYSQPKTTKPDYRQKSSGRPPSVYNTPVTHSYTPPSSSQRTSQPRIQPSPSSRGSSQGGSNYRPSPPSIQRSNQKSSNESSQPEKSRSGGMRHSGRG